MSTLAPWLGHPQAVSQRLHIVRGRDGMYQCKTRRGKLIVLHHTFECALPEAIKTTVKVFDPDNPDERQIIKLARQDPRHAIAEALGVVLDDIWLEDTKSQLNVKPLVPRGSGITGIGG